MLFAILFYYSEHDPHRTSIHNWLDKTLELRYCGLHS